MTYKSVKMYSNLPYVHYVYYTCTVLYTLHIVSIAHVLWT